jgi:glutathione synthase/RimK-type ligase-like ATP-grasp enzyme
MVSLLNEKQNLAIAKYYESQFEYRFYILDSQVLFAYKKMKQNGGWMHNLSQGAVAELIDETYPKYFELKDLSLDAFQALGLRCAAVDILSTSEGFKILEINNGIMMDRFAASSPQYYELAKDAHRKMLFAAILHEM